MFWEPKSPAHRQELTSLPQPVPAGSARGHAPALRAPKAEDDEAAPGRKELRRARRNPGHTHHHVLRVLAPGEVLGSVLAAPLHPSPNADRASLSWVGREGLQESPCLMAAMLLPRQRRGAGGAGFKRGCSLSWLLCDAQHWTTGRAEGAGQEQRSHSPSLLHGAPSPAWLHRAVPSTGDAAPVELPVPSHWLLPGLPRWGSAAHQDPIRRRNCLVKYQTLTARPDIGNRFICLAACSSLAAGNGLSRAGNIQHLKPSGSRGSRPSPSQQRSSQ